MIYLRSFRLPSPAEDEAAFYPGSPILAKTKETCRNSVYPFVLFRERGMPDPFVFRDLDGNDDWKVVSFRKMMDR